MGLVRFRSNSEAIIYQKANYTQELCQRVLHNWNTFKIIANIEEHLILSWMLYFCRDHHTLHLNNPISLTGRELLSTCARAAAPAEDSGIVLKPRLLGGVMALWLFSHLKVYISK